ncbi:biotin--[acetyl-CoA-carboxylase] ligase [Psychromarinibacter sp. C21-152]|uniref:biotin--[biotin carboxyl-carrier protein] ligase n=1 Tax=Psychromarinibacter sediminicola TaxID=3033385 RepID=A0AAE3T746_9RHOB|nr:biotin--[acetyl-CoA-carboxylase] ligase [Psychromarinibacter sediminicola]MDF0599243.1 biotin--[acetyl-CoA-carboxylase] ligase [Psychromarinibacter sediminicola]
MSTDAGWRGATDGGADRIVLDETDSTMAEARRRAPELRAPAWIMARRQTAGHGRRGRAWVSPEGNFAATVVLPAAGVPAQAALRSFTASLALHEALLACGATTEALGLKWPNDVLLNGGKVAGILLESLPRGGVAIGVGVNLATAPGADDVEPGAVRPVALAEETGARVSPADFLAVLAPAFAEWESRFVTYGFSPVRDAWLARAARLGEPVTARLPTEAVTGTFETVDAAGQLVLRTAAGRRSIAAADVYF